MPTKRTAAAKPSRTSRARDMAKAELEFVSGWLPKAKAAQVRTLIASAAGQAKAATSAKAKPRRPAKTTAASTSRPKAQTAAASRKAARPKQPSYQAELSAMEERIAKTG